MDAGGGGVDGRVVRGDGGAATPVICGAGAISGDGRFVRSGRGRDLLRGIIHGQLRESAVILLHCGGSGLCAVHAGGVSAVPPHHFCNKEMDFSKYRHDWAVSLD